MSDDNKQPQSGPGFAVCRGKTFVVSMRPHRHCALNCARFRYPPPLESIEPRLALNRDGSLSCPNELRK